jgi:protein-S-isoprenylcysteine O-methyltransferase Ste14
LAPWWISHWRLGTLLPSRLLGVCIPKRGIIGLLDCFGRFALQGVGTPAPIFPTRHLVVTGFYRHVRNPMYISVAATIPGQSLLFGNVAVLEYGGLVWLLFHLFVPGYEEPTLRGSFGDEYRAYCAAVPRWIPRFTGSFRARLAPGELPSPGQAKACPTTRQPARREG